MSLPLLMAGDFERGWDEYEWRWKAGMAPPRGFQQPRWNGQNLFGKTILLWGEQGLGDTIQFIRYAEVVKRLGATVIVHCRQSLVRLLSSCPGIDRLVGEEDTRPPFDYQIPLLSLPKVLKTNASSIPANVPYVFPDQELVEEWRARLVDIDGFRIAINWRGEPGKPDSGQRALPLEVFAQLAQMEGVRLLRVQKEAGGDELAAAQRLGIVDLGNIDAVHGPFMDTAAILKNVDLTISSDTSVAHLAGAIGVPVWVGLPFVPDWRWLLDRSDSPWYPTMRLFRQKKLGDWSGVVEGIRIALCDMVQRNTR
jgi:ADP-heptose:LPS heptosyltransferase